MKNHMNNDGINAKSLFDKMAKEIREEKFYTSWIDNTNIDVKYKNVLKDLLSLTGKIGEILYPIGKFVVNVLIKTTEFVMRKFPNATKGFVICATLGAMTYFIPIPLVGSLIQPYVAILLGLVGGFEGLFKDLSLNAVRREAFEYANAQFNAGR